MKTISFNKDSGLVKYLAFLDVESYPYETTLWKMSRREDSCALNRYVITQTLFKGLLLSAIFMIALFFGAGFWASLYCLVFDPGMYLDAIIEDWIRISAVLVHVILLLGILLLGIWSLAEYGHKIKLPKPVYKVKGKFIGVVNEISESSAYKLYLAWKDKYCARVEVDTHRYNRWE